MMRIVRKAFFGKWREKRASEAYTKPMLSQRVAGRLKTLG